MLIPIRGTNDDLSKLEIPKVIITIDLSAKWAVHHFLLNYLVPFILKAKRRRCHDREGTTEIEREIKIERVSYKTKGKRKGAKEKETERKIDGEISKERKLAVTIRTIEPDFI